MGYGALTALTRILYFNRSVQDI